jgi:hypothetical protein
MRPRFYRLTIVYTAVMVTITVLLLVKGLH